MVGEPQNRNLTMAQQAPIRDVTADMELRLRCRAMTHSVDGAKELYEWVIGETDRTPKEAILDALEAAGVR